LLKTIKEGKAFGYSATPEEWALTKFEPDKIINVKPFLKSYKGKVPEKIDLTGAYQFYSGKGVSIRFSGVGAEEQPALSLIGNVIGKNQ